MKKFEFLEHTADIKIRVYGYSFEEILKNSIKPFRKIILNNEDKTNKKKAKEEKIIIKKIKISGNDYESLFYNFIEEIIYFIDANDLIIKDIKNILLKKIKNKFDLKIEGEFERFSSYNINNKIKAMTYNDLIIKKIDSTNSKNKKSLLTIEFVLDI
jgi:SHS2 domain-containing protein